MSEGLVVTDADTAAQSRTRAGHYASGQAFDKEMTQLFLKARRCCDAGTEAYGRILVLQVRFA